jgi:hypothetical protein
MLQLAPAFLPKLGRFFARPAVGDDLHLRADVLSKAYSNAGRVEDPIGANGTQ